MVVVVVVEDMAADMAADMAIVMVHLHQVVTVHLQEEAAVMAEVDGVVVSTNSRCYTAKRLGRKSQTDLIKCR